MDKQELYQGRVVSAPVQVVSVTDDGMFAVVETMDGPSSPYGHQCTMYLILARSLRDWQEKAPD